MEQAIADAGLEEAEVSNERTGLIVGAGGPSTRAIVEAAETTRDQGPQAHRPLRGAQGDELRPVGDAGHLVQDPGLNFSISSACATSTHCIGVGCEQILMGKQDVVFAGGCEELDWTLCVLFDAMGAMSAELQRPPGRRPAAPMTTTATASSSPAAAASWCWRS